MVKKLNAELWDKMHYLFRDFNDRVVHAEFEYDFKIDIEALKTVIICAFEKLPVLHSSFTDNHVSPYWTVNKYTIEDVLTVKEAGDDNRRNPRRRKDSDEILCYLPFGKNQTLYY